jgi:hypothetical protein
MGLFIISTALGASAPAKPAFASNDPSPMQALSALKMKNRYADTEGPLTARAGQVEYVLKDPQRLAIGLAPFAQVFFLYPNDPEFAHHMRLLNEAHASKAIVHLTVHAYSGRIIFASLAKP